jgi:hypothetical protein
VYSVKNEYVHETKMLPTRTVMTGKVIQMNARPGRYLHDDFGVEQ